MKITKEHRELIKLAYDNLEKVAEDIPYESIDDNKESELLWKAIMALSVIVD